MGTRRWGWRAAFVAAALSPVAEQARASVVTEPIARLTLEGGYDSNVLYDGRGGSTVQVVSPYVGLLMKNHLWDFSIAYGGSFLVYQSFAPSGVWNQLGAFKLRDQFDRRLELKSDATASYAVDPVGLARLGIVEAPGTGPALIVRGGARLAWRATPTLDVAGTFGERAVRFGNGSGSAVHAPGIEATERFGYRDRIGGAYRFDYFQALSPASGSDAMAHEFKLVYRHEAARDLELEVEGGPAYWIGQGDRALLPEAAANIVATKRTWAGRLSYKHGLGLGSTARPGIYDGIEAAVEAKLTAHWRLAAIGGFWRGTAVPSGTSALLSYVGDGELGYVFGNGARVGLAASRYSRLDDPSPNLQRNVVALRVTWEMKPR